ncbi:hypothetical protein K504DRAFT_537143 [Pleomassaria siparia CBS 279.74]|uniref:NAD(P)-binding domain-containing protein n=1 Tax=Pleomassaria siparia CBS 279.74 TaxID=1314801 RepID=A0A6G1JZI5_9PLEO|nr:hypothetical protein K504DRAFT_537143 [Pleomassaria siparia CBS 279.74]
MSSNTKTILFLCVSGGVGLSALKHSLAAYNACITLCRVPSKLSAIIPSSATLSIIQGNAHDLSAVSKALVTPNGSLVDQVISSIGSGFNSKMAMAQPDVCGTGMKILLQNSSALANPHHGGKQKFGRDVPLLMVPVYNIFVANPIKDRKIMKSLFMESRESFTILTGSVEIGCLSHEPGPISKLKKVEEMN